MVGVFEFQPRREVGMTVRLLVPIFSPEMFCCNFDAVCVCIPYAMRFGVRE